MPEKLTEKFETALRELEKANGLRALRTLAEENGRIYDEGRQMLNLSSNDYMGIGADTGLWQRFLRKEAGREDFGGGSCSSRLLTGNHPAYDPLERKLAQTYGTETALVFASGYHANVGILPAVASARDLILADKRVHASLIDGIRLSRAEVIRFPHNDTERLEKTLKEKRNRYENVFIVTESLFSMDGDYTDLAGLVRLKERYQATLYVDEAHAVGAVGPSGAGEAVRLGIHGKIDFLVDTFGKAYASQGSFLATSHATREYLVNTMRPLIFGTALPPLSLRWTGCVHDALAGMEPQRRKLKELSDRLRTGIAEVGLRTGGSSHIVPVITGSNGSAERLAAYLRKNGFFVLPIRTPTVPKGGERIRISLTTYMKEQDIEKIIGLCARIGK